MAPVSKMYTRYASIIWGGGTRVGGGAASGVSVNRWGSPWRRANGSRRTFRRVGVELR